MISRPLRALAAGTVLLCGVPLASGSSESAPARSALAADGADCGAESCAAVSALQHDATRHRRGAQSVVDPEVGAAGPLKQLMQGLSMTTEFLKIRQEILANEALPEDDAFWSDTAIKIKEFCYTNQDGKEWMDFVEKKDYEGYTKKSCAPDAGGSQMVRGVPADAWYCGRSQGMDWGPRGKPYADLCTAEVGSAYKPGGICDVSNKELLLNFVHKGPLQWGADPTLINVPSIDCIMGIGDGDIYYCQHCAGHCRAD